MLVPETRHRAHGLAFHMEGPGMDEDKLKEWALKWEATLERLELCDILELERFFTGRG